jgi:hypothetical protein
MSADTIAAEFVLEGTTPLLMHQDDVELSDQLAEWRKASENKKISVKGDDRSPAWTWQTYLYQDGTNLVIPSDNVMACLRFAGATVTLKGMKTFKESTQSGILLASEFCEFRCGGKQIPIKPILAMKNKPFKEQADAARAMGFSLFMKRAKVGTAKHVRVRAMFPAGWTVRGTLEVAEFASEITWEILSEIFKASGRAGIGDWRPSSQKSPGRFGMFVAKLKRL